MFKKCKVINSDSKKKQLSIFDFLSSSKKQSAAFHEKNNSLEFGSSVKRKHSFCSTSGCKVLKVSLQVCLAALNFILYRAYVSLGMCIEQRTRQKFLPIFYSLPIIDSKDASQPLRFSIQIVNNFAGVEIFKFAIQRKAYRKLLFSIHEITI